MAKFSREQALRERRARKQEKKDFKKQGTVALDAEAGETPPTDAADGDAPIG